MIGIMYLRLAVFGVIFLQICHGHIMEIDIDEDAERFLNQTSDKLFRYSDELANIVFNNSDKFYFPIEEYGNISMYLKNILDDVHVKRYKILKGEQLKHAFETLRRIAGEDYIAKDILSQLVSILEELHSYSTQEEEKIIADFEDSSIQLPYYPDIDDKIKTSNDPEELEYYWSAWRNITQEEAEEFLNLTVLSIKQGATLIDVSPLEFWLRGFNLTDMENIMEDIRPFYLEFHAFIRDLLRKKYGESIITPDGLIPHHLLTEMSYKIMTNESIIDEMFPLESLPTVDMDKFTSRQVYEIVEGFFESLGFEKFPASIWGDRFRVVKSKSEYNDDTECEPKIWDASPNSHLEYCEEMDFGDYFEAYENMAHLYYAKEMEGLPAYFFMAPNNLNKGIGKAATLSTSTYHNLKAVGMIDDTNITQDVEMNALLRMAMGLIDIPLGFVNAKLMADLLSRKITEAELNKRYWELMYKYAGFGPPKGHIPQYKNELPLSFYTGIFDNEVSSDFTMEVLSYQIHKKLCEDIGEHPKKPLHLCDITGSKDAGNALKKMMQLGSSKPFYKVLGSMFPENPTVRADGLLEYYSPLKKLLVEKNKEANVKPGWKKSDD